MPQLSHLAHDLFAAAQKNARQVRIMALPHLRKVQHFVNDALHVRPVAFGNIAAEMIIARRAGTAAPGIGLFGHQNTRALFRRGNGGHKSGHAAAHHQNISLVHVLFHS